MSKILVIGGAGYIGSHVLKELVKRSYDVLILDNFSKGHRAALQTISSDLITIEGDLGDISLLKEIFTKENIDVVMHFAALIEVAESTQDPSKYYLNNVIKVYTLLEEMKYHKIPYFIFSSTAATFGVPSCDLIDEKHSQIPINPYGHSKLMVEQLLRDYSKAYPEFHYTILRYFNACGGDPEGNIGYSYRPISHVLPMIMEVACGKRNLFKIFGDDYPTPDGTCIRDYIHVCDLAKAHILGMERMLRENISDDFNLGTGSGISVKQIVELAKTITQKDFKVSITNKRPGDPTKLVCNPSKANDLLSWKAQYELVDMMETAWYWANNHKY